METPIGHIQTEVGIVPEEWKIIPLSRLVTEFRGGAPLKPSDFVATGVKVLPKGGVGHKGFLQIDEADLQYCSSTYASAHQNNQVDRSYTIVVLRDLVPSGPSIGLMVLINDAETYVLAQGVYGFKVNEQAEPRFLIQISNSNWYRKLMNSIMVGSTQVHITNTAFKRVKILLPPLPEQRAIAEALSDVDEQITGLTQLIAKKRDLKQAAMQQLLTGKTRLPGFSGRWEVKRLGDVAEIVMGQSPSSSNYNTQGMGTPLIQGNADIENRTTIKRIFTTQITKRGKTGDILMSVRAPVGEISRAIFDVCLGRGVCAIRYKNDYMYHCLIHLEPTWAKHSKGSTFDSVNSADVKALEVHLPPNLPEQTAIAEVLSDMDAEIATLEARLEKTRALKQGMMQELLTGRIRLV